jgi:hypothetical protein
MALGNKLSILILLCVMSSPCFAFSEMECSDNQCFKRTIIGARKIDKCHLQLRVQQQLIPWNPLMPQADLRDWMFSKSKTKLINWKNYGIIDCCNQRFAKDIGNAWSNPKGSSEKIANDYCSMVGL